MNNALRILISCVAAIVVLVICSIIVTFIGITGTIIYIINAAIAVTTGRCLNTFLKKKYPPRNQENDEK